MAEEARRVKVKLTEMSDPDVRWISVVERAASRIPFRVFKADQENGMIDLSNPLRVLKGDKAPAKKEDPKAQVVAVITMDYGDEVQGQVKTLLEANGIPVETVQKNEDGTLTFLTGQGDLTDMADKKLVKLSDETLLVTKGVSMYSDNLKLSDAATARQFMPGVYAATEVMASIISSAMYDVANQQELVTKVEEVTKDFASYILALAKAMPQAVFKADQEIQQIAKSEMAKAKDKEKNKPKASDSEGAAHEGGEGAAHEGKEKEAAKKSDEAGAATDTPEAGAGAEAVAKEGKKVEDLFAALTETIQGLAQKMDALGEKVTAVSEAQETTDQKVAEIAKKAENATQAVNTTILAAPPGGDTPSGTTVQKSEDTDARTGCFDTAFIRRNRQNG